MVGVWRLDRPSEEPPRAGELDGGTGWPTRIDLDHYPRSVLRGGGVQHLGVRATDPDPACLCVPLPVMPAGTLPPFMICKLCVRIDDYAMTSAYHRIECTVLPREDTHERPL